MNINRKLALRKHSIRTLTPTDLRIVHGGDPTNGKGTGPVQRTQRKRA